MEFQEDKTGDFKRIFKRQKPFIENFKGCHSVKLYKDATKHNVFYTYSLWENLQALEEYRKSEIFRKTWEEVKTLFSGKPLAFSLEEV